MKLFLSCLLGLALTSVFSQNTLQGVVTDSDSNTGIAFANIYFPQLEKGSSSDKDGHFTISNLPAGNYRIVCSFIGYETLSMSIDLPYEGDLAISLSATAIEMEGVVVSTPFHKLQSENVMKVERLTMESLKGQGNTTLAEGITSIPGASSVTTGLSIGKPVIRGLSANRVLVYTQGIRLENQQFGDEHGLGINGAGLESVELIKGPASLLYGSDALGGVLYLNPEKFADLNKTYGDLNVDYFTSTQGIITNLGGRYLRAFRLRYPRLPGHQQPLQGARPEDRTGLPGHPL
jgi:iron complex outermembrane receptor protein